MEQDKKNRLIERFTPYLESVPLYSVGIDLEKTDDKYYESFESLKFKSVKKCVLFSVLLGFTGAHRFYAEAFKTAMLKLILNAYLIVALFYTKIDVGIGTVIFMTYVFPFLVINFIWYIVDIFTVYKNIYAINLSKINMLFAKIRKGQI